MEVVESGYSNANAGIAIAIERASASREVKTAKRGREVMGATSSITLDEFDAARVPLHLIRYAAEERVMVRSAHEEKHRKRQPETDAGSEIAPAREALGFGRHRRAMLGILARPFDQAFLHAPHHAPGIQQHEKTKPAADA